MWAGYRNHSYKARQQLTIYLIAFFFFLGQITSLWFTNQCWDKNRQAVGLYLTELLLELGCRQHGTGPSSLLWAAADLLFISLMRWCRHASQLPWRLRQPLCLHLPIMQIVQRLLGEWASCMACQDAERGYRHHRPLGSWNGGWRKHVTIMTQLSTTSRRGPALPVCFSNEATVGFWTTLTERAI